MGLLTPSSGTGSITYEDACGGLNHMYALPCCLLPVPSRCTQRGHAPAEVARHPGRIPREATNEAEEIIARRLYRSRSHDARVSRGVWYAWVFSTHAKSIPGTSPKSRNIL